MSLPSRSPSLLKDHIDIMVFYPFIYLILTRFQCLSISLAPIYFLITYTKSSLPGLLVAYFKVKVLLPDSMFEASRLVKLGRFSGHELALR